MLSPTTKRNIERIVPYGVIWLLYGLVFAQMERGFLAHLTQYPATGNPYYFYLNIFVIPIAACIMGLLVGTLEILYFHSLFIQKSFTQKIIFKSFLYLVIIILFLIGTSIITNSLTREGLDEKAWAYLWAFFTNFAFWSITIYIGSIIIVTQFYTEVSESIGQGVLLNFFTGKYHTPVEEKRIFMFLDMKDSTSIAERLGHVKYFEMLKEYFADLSDPIVRFSGELYQYVGDEIIVSWNMKNGVANNACIQCFFAMKKAIQKQNVKYNSKYGVLPEFKAGLHLGEVTTGEIGVIKKNILFTGDVLNTTARIQGLCNTYHTDILISGELIQQLDLQTQYKIISHGENELKGRDQRIELFSVLVE